MLTDVLNVCLPVCLSVCPFVCVYAEASQQLVVVPWLLACSIHIILLAYHAICT